MNIMKRIAPFVLIASFITPLFGQAERVKPLPLNAIADIEDANKLFRARGGEIDWGLALSGGGIRSGSYSVGVMKALYDAGILDKIDAISTVSGGGYASYWLYGLYDQRRERRFGKSAFADEVYLANVCRLQTVADMQNNWKMVKTLVSSRDTALDIYSSSIHRTFGWSEGRILSKDGDDKFFNRGIDVYNEAINAGYAPYFFINASIYSSELADYGKSIEITGDHIGNPLVGYSRWEDGGAMKLIKSIAISGAGKSKVRNDTANFAPYTLCERKSASSDDPIDKATGRSVCRDNQIDLWDGGRTENLGALPLIKRGLKNVIISDAEHDPRYAFDAYIDLQRILKSIQIDLSVREIDELIRSRGNGADVKYNHATGVMEGIAKNRVTGAVTKIYYIKATRPTDIFVPAFESEMNPFINDRKARQAFIKGKYKDGYNLAEARDKAIGKVGSKSPVACSNAPKTVFDPRMYRFLVNYYGYYILQSKLRKYSGLGGTDLIYDFPQLTTFDQSFYSDQMEAFIGLGFLQGTALTGILKNQ